MMAGHEYNYATRDPVPIYTPSLDSDDELPHMSTLELNDKSYRLFSFRRDGRSWIRAQHSESSLPESEIKARAKRPRKAKHSVEHQMEKMSHPRKSAIEDLLESVKRQDPLADNWEIVAIDNDKPELTKRTGEVLAFSVILARVASMRPLSSPKANTTSSTKPVSRERRRSIYASAAPEPSMPARRASKIYNQNPILDKTSKQSQPPKPTRPANFEDDPFGISHLFSSEGKPLEPVATTSYANLGSNTKNSRPAQTMFGETIGSKSQTLPKEKPGKKAKKSKEEGPIDLDALFSLGSNAADLLGDPLGNNNHQDYRLDQDDHHSSDYDDSPAEIEPEEHEPKSRGRKRNDSGFASQTPKMPPVGQKSKSKPRKPSIHIPKDTKYGPRPVEITSHETPQYASYDAPKYSSRPFELPAQDKYNPRPVQVDVATSGRRRQQPYHSSQISAETAPSTRSTRSYSDHSILEAEYEEYSSSGSSEDQDHHLDQSQSEWGQNPYTSPDGRYKRATRDHRRGPPSPQHPRYDPRYEPDSIPYTTTAPPLSHSHSSSRRPRPERPLSDTSGQIQRYYPTPPTPSSTSTPRPPLITQTTFPRPQDPYYQPLHPHQLHSQGHSPPQHLNTPIYPTSSSTLIYPSDLRAHAAQSYITTQAERDKDQEIERLQWERDMARSERDLARREAELHQEAARRASVVVGGGGGRESMSGSASGRREGGRRYTHEPRLSRRYTDAYYG